jgi:uncharacterized protein YxeA
MVFAIRPRNQGDLTQMKKFMNIMLALALTIGVAGITVAQDKGDTTKKSTKKGKAKKGTDTKDTTKSAPKKGKAKKSTDAPTK